MKKSIKKNQPIKPILKEIQIGCSVMDNEGGSRYINLKKNAKKVTR